MTSPDPAPGRVTLVGGGPGDPDLLTLAGLRALQSADIILTDHLAPDVSTLVNGTEVVNVGKTPHGPATPQEEINALLLQRFLYSDTPGAFAALVDRQGRRIVYPGSYTLAAGGSQPDARSRALGAPQPALCPVTLSGNIREIPC